MKWLLCAYAVVSQSWAIRITRIRTHFISYTVFGAAVSSSNWVSSTIRVDSLSISQQSSDTPYEQCFPSDWAP
ncbi:hypothetical protein PILCRDRAFT_810334 [Piloderma croceum F 1598]|uniref:Uncharacterized protein n=1 Tax=Piloderma croceum (strain F 1598) TaxID=765440 RepID=A0A0C3CRH8_PILCF|nr:hypothetical protein PILCRDRAFT_810334 [Piloderma croceum F 1598]